MVAHSSRRGIADAPSIRALPWRKSSAVGEAGRGENSMRIVVPGTGNFASEPQFLNRNSASIPPPILLIPKQRFSRLYL